MTIGLRFALLLILSTSLSAQESVRQELIRKQRETGLALANYSGSLWVVDPATRDYTPAGAPRTTKRGNGVVSVDGELVAFEMDCCPSHLGVERKDGSGLHEYPEVGSPGPICLSHDKSKVAAGASYQRQYQLIVFNLESTAIDPVGPAGYMTSQCWSPDNKQFVYATVDAPIRIFSLAEKKSRDLVKGEYPSWSPDGQWIAFRDDGKYYVIRPSGADRHLLFEPKNKPASGLWWSPDGSFVAYSQHHKFRDPWWKFWTLRIIKFGGPYELRVRRLADNSNDWVLDEGDTPVTPNYQWILPRPAK